MIGRRLFDKGIGNKFASGREIKSYLLRVPYCLCWAVIHLMVLAHIGFVLPTLEISPGRETVELLLDEKPHYCT